MQLHGSKHGPRVHPFRLPGLPIRWQLLALLLALLVPVLIHFAMSAQRLALDRRADAGRQMLGFARVMAARLDDHVGDIVQALSLIAVIVGPEVKDTDANQALLRRFADRLPPQTNNVSIWDVYGNNVGSLDKRMRQEKVGDRAFFKEAMSHKTFAVEAPVPSIANGMPVGVFALRIERDGRAIGVVAVTSKLRELQQLLMPDGLDITGRVVTVTNDRGVVLARSIEPDKWIGRDLSSGPTGLIQARSRVDGIRDGTSADGIERIAGFATASRVPWLVYVGTPVDAALKEVATSLQSNLFAGSAIFLLGLLLFIWMAGRLVRPLKQLEEDARRFGRGELRHRSEVSGPAEIVLLSSTLNEMAAALRQRDEELQSLAEEQREMLDTDLIAILRVKDRCILWTNAGIDKLLGWGRDELLGRHIRAIYPGEEAHRATGEEAYDALEHGDSFRMQLQLTRKDGGRIWVDMLANRVPARNGELLVMLVDITPIRLEQESRIQSAELAAQNGALRESNRVKTAFLANMSHELRTPLNGIIGYAQILKRRRIAAESSRDQAYLDGIDQSGQQLLLLIDTMLEFAKTDSDRIEVLAAPVDLGALISEVVGLGACFDKAKEIDLLVAVDPHVAMVVTDASILRQVLLQVLSNAIRFSHHAGRVSITASVHEVDSFRIKIQDYGIGIAANDIPRIFVLFQQLSEGATKRHPGTGLGLSLARRLIHAQCGRLEVVSTLGAGSTFSIILPLAGGEVRHGGRTRRPSIS